MKDKNNALYENAIFYKNKNAAVHIKFVSGDWVNGIILDVNPDTKDRLVLQEEKFGEMLILFERIKEDGIVSREEKR